MADKLGHGLTPCVRFGYLVAMSDTVLRKRATKGADPAAAQLLIALREQRGLERSDLPHAMLLAGIKRERIPSTKSIWRIEELGHVPGLGIKAAFAAFYERDIHTIWPPHVPRCAT